MKFDLEFVARMVAMFGEETAKRAMTLPGALCRKQALKNQDQPEEMIAKRDAMVEAIVEFAKEYVNLDND